MKKTLKKKVREARVAHKTVLNLARGVRRTPMALKYLNMACLEANKLANEAGDKVAYNLLVKNIY